MIGYIAGAAAGLLAAYSIFIERKALGLTKLELNYSSLPKPFDGFTILHLSDLHIAHWWAVERKMEEIVRGLDADLLVITGDIAVSAKGAQLVKEFLGRVRPGRETFAVYGNTEHKGDFGRQRREDLVWDGLRLLTNEHVLIERGGDNIILAGVDDPFERYDDLPRALEDAPDDKFKILLAHAPSVAGDAADAGVDLLLSGHTHGGQIRFPLIGAVYPHIRKYKQLVIGLFEGRRLSKILKRDTGEMRVYVSRGIGISNLPMRFLCPPEIVRITLRRTRD
ncbi:MAG: metallophosphoesterase [Armatimonadota bacterium]